MLGTIWYCSNNYSYNINLCIKLRCIDSNGRTINEIKKYTFKSGAYILLILESVIPYTGVNIHNR